MKTAVAVICMFALVADGINAYEPQKLSPGMKIAVSAGRNVLSPQTAGPAGRGVRPMLNAFVKVSPDVDLEALDSLGVRVGASAGGYITASVPADKLEAVTEIRGVEYVEAAGRVYTMLDQAKAVAGVPFEAPEESGVSGICSGKGVVVGVIDNGFDYLHETFRDADGVCRISRVWEQSGTSGKYPSPEKFAYGIELSTPEQISEAGGDVTTNSHGTHVAGIAAGSSGFMDGAFAGVATDAEIVLVSLGGLTDNNVNITDAIDYIFSYADAAGKPCVINMSLGSQTGPHDGTSPFDIMADNLSGPGRLLVGSAGNHGADKFHVAGMFESAESPALASFIDFKKSLSKANAGGVVDVWGEAGFDYGLELICYSLGSGAVAETLEIDMTASEAVEYEFAKNASGAFTVAVETNPRNGKLHAMIKSGLYSLRTRYLIGLRVIPKNGGTVDIWADNVSLGLAGNDIEGFVGPDAANSTIAEIGGTAQSVLSVGAYATRPEYTPSGSSTVRKSGQTTGDVCSFSSFGPTADGRMKPEITAPGCFIISSVSQHDQSGTIELAYENIDGDQVSRYGYMQGTSMAAPFVTGVVAGWLQLNPDLTPEDLKLAVAGSAVRDAFTDGGNAARWGYGKINPAGGIKQVLAGVDCLLGTPAYQDGVLLRGGELVFTRSDRVRVDLYDVAGRMVRTLCADVCAGDVYGISDFAGAERGLYLLSIAGTSWQKTIKVRLTD